MSRSFIKKEGVAQSSLARYLLGEKSGNRLKTIDELASECGFSVGIIIIIFLTPYRSNL